MIGTRLGPYEITAKLGEGGMGVVYQAKDFHLGREVALKVLPEGFTADPERLARFEREARLLAQLNHPNIAQIHGLEVQGDTRALVMELVEGPTLADRLENGALPFNESLSIARQIAEALEEAHEKGIVHRDLKPQNIKASTEGKVKVLDFGLAKALDPRPDTLMSASELARSPTVTLGGTREGVILGTAPYMSPEQARGLAVDEQSDIWAFGVVLYETLTGRSPFAAATVPDSLAAVLTREIDWSALPEATPPAIRRLLRQTLERHAKNRLHDIADARIVLADAIATPWTEPAPPATEKPATRRFAGFALALLALGATLGAAAVWWTTRGGARPAAPLVAALPPPPGTSYYLHTIAPGPARLSPDGSRLVFSAVDIDSIVRLFLRELATGEQRALPATEGAQYPFWSDDGEWIGYFSQRELSLRKIRAAGGSPFTVCRALDGKGGTWNRAGVILFSPSSGAPIYRVHADGGEPVQVTTLDDERFNSHRHPRFLPDGRHFLFLARSPDTARSVVMLSSLDGGQPRELVASTAIAEYAAGHLLYEREGTLLAQPFDPDARELTGPPSSVAARVATIPEVGLALFSVSRTGLLVAHRGALQQPVQLELRNRTGDLVSSVGSPRAGFRDMEFSPDGARLVYSVIAAPHDLFVLDLDRQTETRFTFESSEEVWPAWSPDGETLYYATNPNGPHDIYRKAVGGTGREELVLDFSEVVVPMAVSPDARTLLALRYLPASRELWRLDLGSGRSERMLDRDVFASRVAFSPGGRWVLFVAVEAGRPQVFATLLAGSGRILQVSREGGSMPFWPASGHEILYLDPLGMVYSVPVAVHESTLDLGQARPLFRALPPSSAGFKNVAVSPDGKRFLLARDGAFGAANELVVLTDWTSRLERK